jgi:iron complex outermembrane receptor protein
MWLGWALPALAAAQSPALPPAPEAELAPVVVTATRTESRAFDVPASIDRIGGEALRAGRPQVNLSEGLGSVPGLLARDRQNYAQDVQISVRGFGARSTFGIRGVRLYVDGIPATLPDGQGQISHVDLGSVGRIEVLRGPFSALYGNSSGGVIQVFTEDPTPATTLSAGVSSGSDGVSRLAAKATGTEGGLGYVVSSSRFHTDGARDHSAATRQLGNVKWLLAPDERSQLTVVANTVALPLAQDPLGLSRAQFDANPRGVDPAALPFDATKALAAQGYDTRKTVGQTQAGLGYETRVDEANTVRLQIYLGQRDTTQFQAIPTTTQVNALHPGGVIVLGRDYHGIDLQWTRKGRWADTHWTLVSGLSFDGLAEHRQGFQNFIGPAATPTATGVQGALRRDERNEVGSADQYVQASWQWAPAWSLNAGLRHSTVRFSSRDAYIVGANLDDSGSRSYGATVPVLGLMFAASEAVHLYATAGRGFETPTLNELAYRPNNGSTPVPGLNFSLEPARSDSLELGVKTRWPGLGDLRAAVYRTSTQHEIVTLTNQGGRATFQNAGSTLRTGLELAWTQRWATHLVAQAAYTVLQAHYVDAFRTCVGSPCAVSAQVPVPAGNLIPGLARRSAYADLNWSPPLGWRGGVELRALSRVMVNDLNSDAAAGHAVMAAQLGHGWQAGAWEWTALVRADNLFARRYAGSVIVNEGNARFFEPAPGRTWLGSLAASLHF